MLYEGSSGETAKEIEKLLHLPDEKNYARMKTSAILRSLQVKFNNQFIPLIQMNLFLNFIFFQFQATNQNYVMEIGTKIFVDQSMTPKNWFQRILYLYYNAYIEKLNMTDYKTSIDRINYWVESVTHGHIKDLITQGKNNNNNLHKLIIII